ncbi:MAG TPA: type I polyketide synthase, partial [Candidatus Angelobacter sp.]|nr:type I polyketide synthase [Candidatus Angelobacter sp.]
MNQDLRQIYQDVSNGKLSQKEALDRIRAIKLSKKTGVLLLAPEWHTSSIEIPVGASNIEYAEHHIILCELSQINAGKLGSLLPHSQCLQTLAGPGWNIAQRYSEYARACFERLQVILQGKPQGKVLVQIVIANRQEQVLFAGLSALLKTAALENPQIIGQLVLTASEITIGELAIHLQEEKTGALINDAVIQETLIRHEHGMRQVLRWQEVATAPERSPVAFKDQGVYLITGGLGGLGLLFAKEILTQTAQASVVLTGRTVLAAENRSRLDGLSAQPGRVSYRQVDICDLDQVQKLFISIKDEYGQLNGILHCAGMIADNFILKKTVTQFSEVLAPKVTGVYNLDQAGHDVELDFFVLFSSTAGALGNVGQADYAAANGFMDQFAAYRNQQVAAKQRYGSTRSINWPLWQAGRMGIDAMTRERLQQATGIHPLQTATGLEAFYRSLTLSCDQMMVAEGDLLQMRRALLAGRPVQPESTLVVAGDQSAASTVNAAQLDHGSLAEKTEDYLRKELSGLLKMAAHKIDSQAPLEKYGIDSILAMKLTNQLEKTFGALSKTLFFEYQTIGELSKYFTQTHSARLAAVFAMANSNGHRHAKPVHTHNETRPHAHHKRARFHRAHHTSATAKNADSIAIVGLSGRYPEAINLAVYWQNLKEGKDCIREVPKERWDWQEYFAADRAQDGCHYSKWGGFIAGVDEFDPMFFNISPREAKHLDPQERLFLQHAWMAIEDAGYTRAALQIPCDQDLPGQVGVYVGVMYSEYQLFGAEASVQGKRIGIAPSVASIANRVSYALNLHGPSMTLDTMCSSSLTAIHLACQDLKQGRTSLAIAGGVNVTIHPNKYLALSAGQFISSDGHCQSFGEGGDGYIPGEGVGAVILKRLSDTQRDGDHIYGVIRGSALNHGGKTNGYTVPNPQAQATAISRALAESHT